MGNKFDELYDDFFGKPKKADDAKDENAMDKLPKPVSDLLKNILGFLDEEKNKESDELDENFLNNLANKDLGEPDTDEVEEDGDRYIRRQTWEIDGGTVSRITIGGDIPEGVDKEDFIKNLLASQGIPSHLLGKKKELTLEEKLELAVDSENYEEAARIKLKIDEKQSNN